MDGCETGTDPELDFGGAYLSFSCEKFLTLLCTIGNIAVGGHGSPAPGSAPVVAYDIVHERDKFQLLYEMIELFVVSLQIN